MAIHRSRGQLVPIRLWWGEMMQHTSELCAWCLGADGLLSTQNESHGICEHHAREQLARLAARRRASKTVNFVLVETETPAPLFFPFVDHDNRWPCYPRNWSKISWVLRRSCGFRCEWCSSSEQVSVHHMGAAFPTGRPSHRNDKRDCRRENLYVLCGRCHRWIEQVLRDMERDEIKKHRALGVGVGLVVWSGDCISAL